MSLAYECCRFFGHELNSHSPDISTDISVSIIVIVSKLYELQACCIVATLINCYVYYVFLQGIDFSMALQNYELDYSDDDVSDDDGQWE